MIIYTVYLVFVSVKILAAVHGEMKILTDFLSPYHSPHTGASIW